MDPRRLQRLSEAMREEINEIIGYELSDPRMLAVTVTDVHVSPDSRKARVMVQIAADPAEQTETLEAVRKAGGYIRHQLADRIELFRIPEIRFEMDAMVNTKKLAQLLKRMRKGRPREDQKNPVE